MKKITLFKYLTGIGSLFSMGTMFAININCQLTVGSSSTLNLQPNQVGTVSYNCSGKGLGTLTKYKLSFSGAGNLNISDVYSKSPHSVNISGNTPGTYTLSVSGMNWGAPTPPITFTSTPLTVIIQGGTPDVSGTLSCPATVTVNTQTDCTLALLNSTTVPVNTTVSLTSTNVGQSFGPSQVCDGLTNNNSCNFTFPFTPTDVGTQTISVNYQGMPSSTPTINTQTVQVVAAPTPNITGVLNCPGSVNTDTQTSCSVSLSNSNNVAGNGTVSLSSNPSVAFSPGSTDCTNIINGTPYNSTFTFTTPGDAGSMTVTATYTGTPAIVIPSDTIQITQPTPPVSEITGIFQGACAVPLDFPSLSSTTCDVEFVNHTSNTYSSLTADNFVSSFDGGTISYQNGTCTQLNPNGSCVGAFNVVLNLPTPSLNVPISIKFNYNNTDLGGITTDLQYSNNLLGITGFNCSQNVVSGGQTINCNIDATPQIPFGDQINNPDFQIQLSSPIQGQLGSVSVNNPSSISGATTIPFTYTAPASFPGGKITLSLNYSDASYISTVLLDFIVSGFLKISLACVLFGLPS